MGREEFVKAMTFLGLAYNKEFDQNTVAVWYTFFQKDSFEDFKQAITRLITKSRFMPSIADIRGELADLRDPQKTPEEAWDGVVKAISDYGYYRADKAMESLDPVSQQAVRNLGGFEALCTTDNTVWMRKTFLELYKSLTERRKDALRQPYLTENETKRLEARN